MRPHTVSSAPSVPAGLNAQEQISTAVAAGRAPPAVLDVRPALQFSLMHLPHATHIPFEHLDARLEEVKRLVGSNGKASAAADASNAEAGLPNGSCRAEPSHPKQGTQNGEQKGHKGGGGASADCKLYVMCRRGNNSQLAVARLREAGILNAVDVVGGMENWARSVDDTMPIV